MIFEIDSLSKHPSLFYTSVDKHHLLTVWRDSKVILLVSNIGSNSISKTTRKLGQEASSTMVPCPENIIKYSETARGVDLMDQMIGYYHVELRSKKWYKPIINRLLQIAL